MSVWPAQLEYLGHIISTQGIEVDGTKIEAMQNWSPSESLKEVRGFLGPIGYHRWFVKGYGNIARPLTNQLKKDGLKWSLEAEQAFRQMKLAMSFILVLALLDFNKPFILEIDASSHGLGDVLMQDLLPISCFSHALPPWAHQKSVYERELMAIVFIVQKWHHYLP